MIIDAVKTGKADFREYAICQLVDPETFFPKERNDAASEPAKKICRLCPVREACLEEAFIQKIEWGVWGGLNERERRAILRKKNPKSK